MSGTADDGNGVGAAGAAAGRDGSAATAGAASGTTVGAAAGAGADLRAGLAAGAEAGNASCNLRTTGASIVEDAERTNSPSSWSLAMTALLSTPRSLASS
jgi:hypothetical protein